MEQWIIQVKTVLLDKDEKNYVQHLRVCVVLMALKKNSECNMDVLTETAALQ